MKHKRTTRLLSLLALVGLVVGPAALVYAAGTWTQQSPTPSPSARYAPAMAYLGGDQVLLFGGYDGSGYNGETWVYDLSANTWTQQSPAASPSARYIHAMAYLGGDQVLLFGGEDGTYDGETWLATGFGPTAVTLVSFSAAAQGNTIRLDWETATELDNLGFNVLRRDSPTGESLRLNTALIPTQNPGSPVGAVYTFLDETAAPGVTYYYWLEDVDVYGAATLHGPVTAELNLLRRLLPVRPRLAPAPLGMYSR